MDLLPVDCVARVLSFTSPRDACKSSVVSTGFHAAAESDLLWENFLPSDYHEILSRLVSPVEFKSRKELFHKLCRPLLIDGGKKTFSLDKSTSKKCYMLSARELSITWSSNPLNWCWKHFSQSRFPEVVELIFVCWLQIHGKINTRMLSPNTTYAAYLIIKIVDRAHGLDTVPSEVSVELRNYQSRGTIYLHRKEISPRERQRSEGVYNPNGIESMRSRVVFEGEERIPREREDGWLEIELGEFYNDESDREVEMSLREIKGEHLKGGIVVEGIEIRPKE